VFSDTALSRSGPRPRALSLQEPRRARSGTAPRAAGPTTGRAAARSAGAIPPGRRPRPLIYRAPSSTPRPLTARRFPQGAYLGLRTYACQRRAHSARPPRPRHIRAEQPRATGARSPPVVRNTHPPAVTGRSGDSGCVARSGGQASVCKRKDLPNKFNCPCILNNRKYARLWCPNAQLYLFQNFMSPIGCAEDFGILCP